jgi:hypothetical protein
VEHLSSGTKGGDAMSNYEIAMLVFQCIGITSSVIIGLVGIIISFAKRK